MDDVRAVLFDMDDTLFSRRDAFRRYAERFYDSQSGMHETPGDEAIALMTEWDGRGDNDKHLYFGKIKDRWPGVTAPDPRLIDDFFDRLSAAVRPDEQALALLRELNSAGVPWGIVTNGAAYQLDKLRISGLDGLPRFTIVSRIFGHNKPDPRIFEEALRQLGCGPEETLFTGDNPHTDIRGAQAVGMPTAWVRAGREWTWGKPVPDRQIDHVSELRDVLLR